MADYNELFKMDGTNKQLHIAIDDYGHFYNRDIYSESFSLEESLCSQSHLRFGACEASCVQFTIGYSEISLKGRWMTIEVSIDDEDPYQIGRYRIYSDKPTADRQHREIIAYDALYDILNADIAEWYNETLTNYGTITFFQFRNMLFNHFGITQESVNLPQDSMLVKKTITPTKLPGKYVIEKICELNGCFGHITRDGKFKYIFLPEIGEGLFPSVNLYPKDGLYPSSAKNATDYYSADYITVHYEDYASRKIDKLQIRQSENDIGLVYGDGTNCYVVEDNFLVYGLSSAELLPIAQKLFEKLSSVKYIPCDVEMRGNLTIEVGTAIVINTTSKKIRTYVLERSFRGIQALFDTFTAKGEEYCDTDVNSVQSEFVRLQGKSNELSRTIEETRSTITDVAAGLQSQITQNANAITAEVARATGAEGQLGTRITQTATEIRSEVNTKIAETKEYADNAADTAEAAAKADTDEKLSFYSTTSEMNSAISQTATEITSSVERQITETKEYALSAANTAENNANAATNNKLQAYSTTAQMNSAISQSADAITSSVEAQIDEVMDYADGVGANAVSAAAADATSKANAATAAANAATDTKLANYSTTQQMNTAISQSASNITSSVASTYATQASLQQEVANLQAQIDDSVETFTGPDVPTLQNYPAVNWTTTQMKDGHIGDLYVVNSQGGAYANFYYRFEKNNGIYQWALMQDTEVTTALAQSAAALALAQELEGTLQTDYSTTQQMNSAISQSGNQILSTVSSTYETKADATLKLNTAKDYADDVAGDAEDAANAATDTKLLSYSTTVQMNSAINQKADEITLSVEEQIEDTKDYADGVAATAASTAQSNANTYTNTRLQSYSTTSQMNTKINATKDSILATVSEEINETKTYADDAAEAAEAAAKADTDTKLQSYSTTTQMNSAINQKANEITTTVSETYETQTHANSNYNSLSSSITQTGSAITAEVTRATEAEGELSQRITATAEGISSKVSKGDVSSEISQEAGQINISSNRLSINSTYFTLSADGTINATNAHLSGEITATSGEIGGFTITNNSIYTGQNTLGGTGIYLGSSGFSVKGSWGSTVIQNDGSAKFTTLGFVEIQNTSVSAYKTSIGSKSIEISGSAGSNKLTDTNLVITYNGYNTTTLTDSYLEFKHNSDKITLGQSGLIFYNGSSYRDLFTITPPVGSSGTVKLEGGGSTTVEILSSSTGKIKLTVGSNSPIILDNSKSFYGSSSYTLVGTYGKYLGFFAVSGASSSTAALKQTVSKISSPSSASTSVIANKLNDLITALNKYNLIGI